MSLPMEGWLEQAQCAGDPSFDPFPAKYEKELMQYDKALCRQCPVRCECWIQGFKNKEEGIYGGNTFEERNLLAAVMRFTLTTSSVEISSRLNILWSNI